MKIRIYGKVDSTFLYEKAITSTHYKMINNFMKVEASISDGNECIYYLLHMSYRRAKVIENDIDNINNKYLI